MNPRTLDAPFPAAQGQMLGAGGNYIMGVAGSGDSVIVYIIDINKDVLIGYRTRLILGRPAILETLEPKDLRAIFKRLDTVRPKPKGR